MTSTDPNQALRTKAIDLSTVLISTGVVQSVVLIIGVGVTGLA